MDPLSCFTSTSLVRFFKYTSKCITTCRYLLHLNIPLSLCLFVVLQVRKSPHPHHQPSTPLTFFPLPATSFLIKVSIEPYSQHLILFHTHREAMCTQIPTDSSPSNSVRPSDSVCTIIKPAGIEPGKTKCLECGDFECCCIPLPCVIL